MPQIIRRAVREINSGLQRMQFGVVHEGPIP
jgi:hypothetical protein